MIMKSITFLVTILLIFAALDTRAQTKNDQEVKSIMKNTVMIKKVSFKSNSIKIAANLYYPEGFKPGDKPTPAVVVAHPAAGVKEQTAGLYAQRLAEKRLYHFSF